MTIRRVNDTAARIKGRDGRTVKPSAKPAPGKGPVRAPVKPPPNLKANNRKSRSAPVDNIHHTGERYTKQNSVSFDRLFRNAAVTDSKYVKDVTVTSLKRIPKGTGIVGYDSRTLTVDGKLPRKYTHFVIARDGRQVSQSQAVKVSCQCPRFMFYYEYALAKRNAADIIYSNGEAAVVNNPANIPSACKHLLAVMYRILKAERG